MWGDLNVTSATISLGNLTRCGQYINWTEQSPEGWGLVGLWKGRDTKDHISQFLQKCIGEDLNLLNNNVFDIQCHKKHCHILKVKIVVIGDHMSLYKIVGADPPSSSKAERRPCPWCNISPIELKDLKKPILLEINKFNSKSLIDDFPLNQIMPDCLHGLSNIIQTCLLPLTREIFHTYIKFLKIFFMKM